MDDYTLYLVKRAYLKKRAQGVTILGQPIMYDPYSVYKKRKQAIIDAIQKPKFTHDNANRMAQEYVDSRRNMYKNVGTVAGGVGAMLGTNMLLGNRGLGTRIPGIIGSATVGGIGGNLIGSAVSNIGSTAARRRGYDAGDALDREAFQAAQKKYDADVAKAVRDFNMKYTGMEDPDKDAIYRGGIKLHDEK